MKNEGKARARDQGGCPCDCPARRDFLKTALAAGVGVGLAGPAWTQEGKPGSEDRPRSDDLLVFSEGDQEGELIKPADLVLGATQTLAWPMDPATKVVRDGSRLNQVLLLRLDPANLDETTREHAADGIVAYSAICTHQQCPVTGWNKEKGVLHCYCHDSEYDPREDGKVVFGPAPRALPALPVKLDDGKLVVAGPFLGRVGIRQS